MNKMRCFKEPSQRTYCLRLVGQAQPYCPHWGFEHFCGKCEKRMVFEVKTARVGEMTPTNEFVCGKSPMEHTNCCSDGVTPTHQLQYWRKNLLLMRIE